MSIESVFQHAHVSFKPQRADAQCRPFIKILPKDHNVQGKSFKYKYFYKLLFFIFHSYLPMSNDSPQNHLLEKEQRIFLFHKSHFRIVRIRPRKFQEHKVKAKICKRTVSMVK